MNPFSFYNPVRVVFGPGVFERLGTECSSLGKKALLVSYSSPGPLGPVIEKAQRLLENAGIACVPFCGVSPNPLTSEARKGVALAREHKVDMVIGLGGGSAMDSAKIIAAGFYYEQDLWNMIISRHDANTSIPPQKALPIVLVPTLPATSSEMNAGAVITNDEKMEKSYVFNENLFAHKAIMDPELTLSLPAYQSALGAADAVSHAMETYLNTEEDCHLQRRLALSCIETIMEAIQKILKDPKDIAARTTMMWAACVAWNGWTSTGADHGCPMHQLGHVLSARYNVPHGGTLAIIMPAWMKYNLEMNLQRYAALDAQLFKKTSAHYDAAAGREMISRFEGWLKQIGVPTRLGDAGVKADAIDSMAQDVIRISGRADGTVNGRPGVGLEDVKAIYRLAL